MQKPPRKSSICDPQKSASLTASEIHAETSRFRHGTMVLSPVLNTGADDGQGEAGCDLSAGEHRGADGRQPAPRAGGCRQGLLRPALRLIEPRPVDIQYGV